MEEWIRFLHRMTHNPGQVGLAGERCQDRFPRSGDGLFWCSCGHSPQLGQLLWVDMGFQSSEDRNDQKEATVNDDRDGNRLMAYVFLSKAYA